MAQYDARTTSENRTGEVHHLFNTSPVAALPARQEAALPCYAQGLWKGDLHIDFGSLNNGQQSFD